MILKIMIASWNLRWQMQIRLYYQGPAWAAEARKCSAILLVGYSIWYSVYQVHHCNASINADIGIGGVEVTESTGRGVVQQWHRYEFGTVSGTGISEVQ